MHLIPRLPVCEKRYCKRGLAIDEDDGQITRELVSVDEAFMKKGDDEEVEYSSATLGLEQKAMCTTFTMRVKTGDKKNADTDANVFATLYGTKDDTAATAGWFLDWVEVDAPFLGLRLRFPCGRWLYKGEDERRRGHLVPYEIETFASDLFAVGTDADVFTVLYGRDGGVHPAEVSLFNKRERTMSFEKGAEDMFIVEGSETIIFSCEHWLAKSEDDGETVYAMTGDVYNRGTDANVFLTIYRDLGDTCEHKLSKSETNSNKFEKGALDKCTIEAVDLGQVFRIKIRHDNSMVSADWYLDHMEVVDEDLEEVLSVDSNMNKKSNKKNEDVQKKGSIMPYHFTISTGAEKDASTSSTVYVGPNHTQTEGLWLDLRGGKKCFDSGSLESFESHGVDVGEIRRVELVDELAVAVPTKGVKYIFQCKYGLTKDWGDGLAARVFNVLDADSITISQKAILRLYLLYLQYTIIYEVTGDVLNAGTDTQIYRSVFGANSTTEGILLQNNEDRFERGQEDTFSLEVDDIAPLMKMRARIDGSGSQPDWFLDKIIMHNLTTEDVSEFTYEEWLPWWTRRRWWREPPTSSRSRPVTLEVVFHRRAEQRRSGLLIDTIEELGWHIEFIDVKDEALDKTFRFPCDRWLVKKEDDGQIMRELVCTNNDILDLNEKTNNAETKENIWIALEGKKGRSK
ncbi:unnamed protein product [Coregonus sp. 'balchen']|nr:unnamed protein product [Coregonus sp. 'balchen']